MVNLFGVPLDARHRGAYLGELPHPFGNRLSIGKGVLTGVWGGGISAAPLWLDGQVWLEGRLWSRGRWGLLIEIVGKGRDARAAARVAGRWRICERFGGPDMGLSARAGVPWGVSLQGAGHGGWAWDKLESLILAQNERWRHA
jgi:hypothetical protein